MAWIILDSNGGLVTLKVKVQTLCNWFFYYGVSGHADADAKQYPAGQFSLKLGIASSNTGSEPISLFFTNPSGQAEGYRVDLEWFQADKQGNAVSRGQETLLSTGPVPVGATPVPPNGTCTVPAGVHYQLMPIQQLVAVAAAATASTTVAGAQPLTTTNP